MDDLLLILLSITTILAIYWITIGQWKYNKMMKQSNKIKSVIFDLDGVIIDSLDAWFNVFNKTRQHYKLPKIHKEDFIKDIWGGPIEKDVKNYFNEATVEEISKIYFSNIGKFKEKTKLNHNVKETLKKLREKDVKIGLVTNSYRKPVIEILNHHKVKSYFDVIVGGDETENGKPAPDPLFEACKRLNIKPEEAILVGDTNSDKGAAKNAKMLFIGYKTDGNLKIDDLKGILRLV